MLVLTGAGMAPLAASGQTATWLLNPGTGNFSTATNWSPNAVPLGTAIFGATNTNGINLNVGTATIGNFQFNSGAPTYTFFGTAGLNLTFSGVGIINNSSNQSTLTFTNGNTLSLINSATLGNLRINGGPATISFNDSSSAGRAVIENNGGTMTFDDTSTAANATITNIGGGTLCFCNNATAGSAIITNTGAGAVLNFFVGSTASAANITNAGGATLNFEDSSSAGTATITNTGGTVNFKETSGGGTARYVGTAGTLDISALTSTGMAIGSVEGGGAIALGAK